MVMVMVWLEVTALVVIVKKKDDTPAGNVTLEGTLTALPLVRSVTTTPPVGAGPESRTVPVTLVPPVTEELVKDRLVSVTVTAGTFEIVRVAVRVTPAYVAVIVGVWLEVTALVAIVKVTEDWPAGTVTLAGTCAAA